MTQSKRETERKYAAPPADDTAWLRELTDVDGVVSVVERGSEDLDAVYHDTEDLRLAGASATLRRRTGGHDAGWHLKLPLPGDSREEVQAPVSPTIPDDLRALALSRTRGAPLAPVVRVRSTRSARDLLGRDDEKLAELTVDSVHAESLGATTTRTPTW